MGNAAAGQSETDTRHFSIDGTSFNPSSGAVKGLSTLDSNLEVSTACTSAWVHQAAMLVPTYSYHPGNTACLQGREGGSSAMRLL